MNFWIDENLSFDKPIIVWNSYLVFVDWYAIPLDCTHCFDGVSQENQVWLHFERFCDIRIRFINSCHHLDLWFPSRSRSDCKRVRSKSIFHNRCESYVNKFVEFQFQWIPLQRVELSNVLQAMASRIGLFYWTRFRTCGL